MELLKDMSLFVEVCKVMSFRKAAENLEMPSSTLSRRISHLEEEIGLRLLHRTTRKVELTEAGSIYFERCKRIVSEAKLAHEQLGEMLSKPSGILRISLPVDFGTIFLTPLLVEFAEHYPGINFEIDLTPRLVDLVAQNIDVVIRMGNLPDSHLIAHKLMQFQGQLFASPEYLEQHGIPQHPNALVNHECLSFPNNMHWKLSNKGEVVDVTIGSRFVLNNVGMTKQLAILGKGVIFTPYDVVRDDVNNTRLVPILPEWFGDALPVYALTETRLLPAKVRVFLEFLKTRLVSNSGITSEI
ncbi:DNA-binding transcriptional regulator, LysR family [Acinetobacter marinus]|uniref:DNA-binding transcriptional regulator, LysR family n=1 Tax=Acinetobacter marinus TaxID=281375 RepID=A0A1G6LFA9_9GAMM|nr:LysR family transcriptional regulator [Acinetobacter marinus]SDC41930.1 DNA-binding transcriptional regulator, LysR family [Acinetobacter marinus]